MNAVTCLKWIKRGVSKRQPDEVKLTDSDMRNLIESVQDAKLSDSENDISDTDSKRKRKIPTSKVKIDDNTNDEMKEMEESDIASDDDESEDDDAGKGDRNPLSFSALAYYGGNAKDPDLLEEADSEDEDLQVLPDDNLVVIGKVKREFCTLEVYVYNEKDNNCFCHHDLILPTIPLCMEWLDYDPAEENCGNLVAVGNVGPDIEVWDLDVVNTLEPAFVLAGTEKRSGKKKKKTSNSGHSDAVLGLSWNQAYRHVLASGSADCTAALWDLSEGKVVTSIPHTDKVQTLQWQPGNAQSLLTGCADKTVNLYDCSSLEPSKKTWTVTGEVENVCWDAYNEYNFFVGTDSGYLYKFDSRTDKPLSRVQAHTSAVSSIAQSCKISGCVVTAGTDKLVKIWDMRQSVPTQVFTKKLNMGQLFDISGCPDSPCLFAVAGELEFRVLNFTKTSELKDCFDVDSDKEVCEEVQDIEVPIGYDDAVDSESCDEESQTALKEQPQHSACDARAPKQQQNGASEDATKPKTAQQQQEGDVSKKRKKRLRKKANRKLKTPESGADNQIVDTAIEDVNVDEDQIKPEVETYEESGAANEVPASKVSVKAKPEKVAKPKKTGSHPAARRMIYKTKQQPQGDDAHKRFN